MLSIHDSLSASDAQLSHIMSDLVTNCEKRWEKSKKSGCMTKDATANLEGMLNVSFITSVDQGAASERYLGKVFEFHRVLVFSRGFLLHGGSFG